MLANGHARNLDDLLLALTTGRTLPRTRFSGDLERAELGPHQRGACLARRRRMMSRMATAAAAITAHVPRVPLLGAMRAATVPEVAA